MKNRILSMMLALLMAFGTFGITLMKYFSALYPRFELNTMNLNMTQLYQLRLTHSLVQQQVQSRKLQSDETAHQ